MGEPSEKSEMQVKHDWYQTEATVTITVLIRNLSKETTNVIFTPENVTLKTVHADLGEFTKTFQLSHQINSEQCSYIITPSKIEIRLKKIDGIRWDKLEGKDCNISAPLATVSSSSSAGPPTYPTSKKGKDWSAYEKQLKEDEHKEKPEGDEALNKLFQEIYGKGDDNTKRAMNKSYMESGGTVLSTNWGEIEKDKVPVKPPDGMEFKKWDD